MLMVVNLFIEILKATAISIIFSAFLLYPLSFSLNLHLLLFLIFHHNLIAAIIVIVRVKTANHWDGNNFIDLT